MAAQAPPAPQPLLPFELMDAAEQRTWVVSGFVLLQSFKLWQCAETFFLAEDDYAPSGSAYLLLKWCFIDAFLIGYAIPRLRLPKLDWPRPSRLILLAPLLLCNWLLFTSVAWSWLGALPTTILSSIVPDYRMAVDEHRVRYGALQDPSEHILGKHTVHVLPHASARMAPQQTSFCLPLDDKKASISIPLLFNNTRPHSVSYSVTDPVTGHKNVFDLSERDILAKNAAPVTRPEDTDDWGLPAKPDPQQKLLTDSNSGRYKGSKHSHALQISQPGIVHLERLISVHPHADIPFSRMDSVLIVPCPTAKLETSSQKQDVCTGASTDAQVQLSGVPPLALEYLRYAPAPIAAAAVPETLKLESISSSTKLVQGQSTDITVPLDIKLQETGLHRFQLSRVTDKFGNFVSLFDPAGGKKKRTKNPNEWSVYVHGTASAQLQGCSSRQPLKLLQGSKVSFDVVVDGTVAGEGPYKVGMLQPDGSQKTLSIDQPSSKSALSRLSKTVEVSEPGQFELMGVAGRYCDGLVNAPLACPVNYQPPPTLDLNFTTLNDACAGSIGLKASALLTGEPPFKIHYQVTHKRDRSHERTTTHTRVVQNTHDEIVFQPEHIGSYTWQALRLEDSSYKGAQAQDLRSNKDLQAMTTVHPLASAKWAVSKDEEARNCEGKTVEAQVELTGDAPFSLEYQVQYGNKRETKSVNNLSDKSVKLEVPIPSKLDKNGGTMTLSLTKITDGRKCQRSLQTDDLNIHVRRTKPTARIYHGSKEGQVARVRQDQDVSIPLRLTGEGPWTVTYRRTSAGDNHERTVKLHSPNAELLVNQQGSYQLLSVHDRFCSGSVTAEKPFVVEFIEKPTLSVKIDDKGAKSSSWLSSFESLRRAPVCVNTPDSAELHLTGTAPFRVQYAIITESGRAEKSLLAVQNTAYLLLSTGQPGKVEYEITGVSDSLYEGFRDGRLFGLGKSDQVKTIRLEQQVLGLPSGSFKPTSKPAKACVNSPLAGKDTGLTLQLVGQAPFDVELEVGGAGSGANSRRFPVHDIKSNEWPVELRDYNLANAGKHEVRLISVADAHGCKSVVDRAALTASKTPDDFALVRHQPLKAGIDVLESASIVAANPRKDICVGESLDFILQGSPPFSVNYQWEGKNHPVQVRNTQFSRIAEKAGTFKITSVAHQATQCQTSVDIEKTIRPIPRVQVDNKVEDIREGDRTEIKFSFFGTPPFTFKYTRSHPLRPDEVLEEKTIAGIMDDSYSVYASSEGVWEVKYISDAYCAFPPSQKASSR